MRTDLGATDCGLLYREFSGVPNYKNAAFYALEIWVAIWNYDSLLLSSLCAGERSEGVSIELFIWLDNTMVFLSVFVRLNASVISPFEATSDLWVVLPGSVRHMFGPSWPSWPALSFPWLINRANLLKNYSFSSPAGASMSLSGLVLISLILNLSCIRVTARR